MSKVSTLALSGSFDRVEAKFTDVIEAFHVFTDLMPAKSFILSGNFRHRTGPHHSQLSARKFKRLRNALLPRHRTCAQDFLPVDGILEIFESGGMVVGIRHGELGGEVSLGNVRLQVRKMLTARELRQVERKRDRVLDLGSGRVGFVGLGLCPLGRCGI